MQSDICLYKPRYALTQSYVFKHPQNTEQLCCEWARDSLKQSHCEETGHDASSPQVFQEVTDRMVTHFDLWPAINSSFRVWLQMSDPWDTMIPFFSAPSLALSDTFYDSPSYCSEMDKNNMLMRSAGVSSSRGLGCTGFRGVRLAPQTQEGSTVSHSQGVSRLDTCVPSRTPHLQLCLLISEAQSHHSWPVHSDGWDERTEARACRFKVIQLWIYCLCSKCAAKMIRFLKCFRTLKVTCDVSLI